MAAADGYLLAYSLQQQRGAEVADNFHRRGAPVDKPPGFADQPLLAIMRPFLRATQH